MTEKPQITCFPMSTTYTSNPLAWLSKPSTLSALHDCTTWSFITHLLQLFDSSIICAFLFPCPCLCPPFPQMSCYHHLHAKNSYQFFSASHSERHPQSHPPAKISNYLCACTIPMALTTYYLRCILLTVLSVLMKDRDSNAYLELLQNSQHDKFRASKISDKWMNEWIELNWIELN